MHLPTDTAMRNSEVVEGGGLDCGLWWRDTPAGVEVPQQEVLGVSIIIRSPHGSSFPCDLSATPTASSGGGVKIGQCSPTSCYISIICCLYSSLGPNHCFAVEEACLCGFEAIRSMIKTRK